MRTQAITQTARRVPRAKRTWTLAVRKELTRNWQLYLFMVIPVALFITFNYVPMYGVLMAFQNYMPGKGISGSEWVGLYHFNRFFNSYNFWLLMKNTLQLSFYGLIFGFPIPIIFALMLNEMRGKRYKSFVQTVSYAPHFISCVVMVGMITSFLSPSTGIVNILLQRLGLEPVAFMQEPKYFKSIYVITGIWQELGWSAIIYIAALSGIDPQLQEAARIDGAGRMRVIWHINLPTIMPTIVILLIMSVGGIMNVGFEKAFLMQNPLNQESSEIISTYVYKTGLVGAQYSFGAAVGLFNSVVNFLLLIVVNFIAGKLNDTKLW